MSRSNEILTGDESLFSIRNELNETPVEQFTEREQFIGVLIDKEQFMLPISVVSEIMMLPTITYLPKAPRFVEGVINLRGHILPAINLRKMMGLPRVHPTAATRIIICRHEDITVGLLVDGITSVESMRPTEVEDNSMGTKILGVDILGRMTKKDDRVRGILDVEKILTEIVGKSLNASKSETAA